MSLKNHIAAFLIIFCASFSLKLLYVSYTDNWKKGGAPDTKDFLEVSNGLLSGDITPSYKYDLTYYRLFPMYLTGMRLIFGDTFLLKNKRKNFRLFQIGIYAFISYLVYILAYYLYNQTTAFLASLFYVFSFSTTFWSHYLLTEGLFSLCFITHTLFLVSFYKSKNSYYIISSVLFLILACLTRPILIFYPLMLLIWALFQDHAKDKQTWFIPVSGLVFILAIVVYHYSPLHTLQSQWIPIKQILTNNLNNIEKYAYADQDNTESEPNRESIWYFSPGRDFNESWKEATFIKKSSLTLRIFFMRLFEFWSPTLLGSHQSWKDSKFILVYTVYYLLIFSLCILGCCITPLRQHSNFLLVLILFYFTAVYAGSLRGGGIASRYRVPIEPYISIYAAMSFINLRQKYLN